MSYLKPIAKIGAAYMMYEIGKAIWWELKIQNYSSRVVETGGIMTEEDKIEKEAIKHYLDNHYGNQLMNKLSA